MVSVLKIYIAFDGKYYCEPEMGIKDRRSNIKHGRYSNVLVIPASIEKGAESTLAANRLLLVDTRGEISESDLLKFLEDCIEPRFWV